MVDFLKACEAVKQRFLFGRSNNSARTAKWSRCEVLRLFQVEYIPHACPGGVHLIMKTMDRPGPPPVLFVTDQYGVVVRIGKYMHIHR